MPIAMYRPGRIESPSEVAASERARQPSMRRAPAASTESTGVVASDSTRMSEIRQRFVETNGVRLFVAEAGKGPLVLLLHGFPESWYSYRHQLLALADAGYHAVAP